VPVREPTTALSFTDVRVQVRGRELLALASLQVELRAGSVLGVVGANGSGKTTLLNTLGGFLRQSSGTISLLGKVVDRLPPWRRFKLGVGRLWQDLRLFDDVGSIDNVALAIRASADERLWSALLKPKQLARRDLDAAKAAESVLGRLDVRHDWHTPVANLSDGQRKWVALARATAVRRDLVFLDEPASGLDAVGRATAERFILDLRGEGAAVVVVEHDLSFLSRVADEVLHLDQGTCAAYGGAPEVLRRLLPRSPSRPGLE